ncbi:MAG TPA: hypothetical protein VGB89_08040 [Bacteroidota bacterium]
MATLTIGCETRTHVVGIFCTHVVGPMAVDARSGYASVLTDVLGFMA